eukprot:gene2615-3575_t
MSRFLSTTSAVGKDVIEVIEAGIDGAFDEVIHIISKQAVNKEGIQIEFTNKSIQTFSDILGLFSFTKDWKITQELQDAFLAELCLNGQEFVVQPNIYDVSHNYKSWTSFTDGTFYARSMTETDEQYTLEIPEEEKKSIIDMWLKRYPRLKINDDDSDDLKKQKEHVINQIPHSVKVGEELFTRKEFTVDNTTNYLLGCFAQWFIEEAFKTGIDIHAKVGVESLYESEFKKQWGLNRIDLSNLYGTNEEITNALRLKRDGKLKVQKVKVGDIKCDFPPKITFKTKDIADDECPQSIIQMYAPPGWSDEDIVEKLYALGHPRFNLHFGLCLIQTLFIREHNQVAELVKLENPEWSDEQIFQNTRIILIAELSKMVVEDYINHILHAKNVRVNYKPEILFKSKFQYQERLHFEFNYLYRWHSMVPTDFTLGKETHKFKDLQFKPKYIQEYGLETIVGNVTSQNIGRLGLNNTVDFLKPIEITTLLHSRVFKAKSFVEYKEFFEAVEIKDFSDITKNEELQKKLKEIYKDPKNIDYYVGLLAEDHDYLVPDLMQQQLAIYAFTAIYSNPVASEHNWNEATMTKIGWERIHNTRLSNFLNRNLQETGGKNIINPNNDPEFDVFRGYANQFSIPNDEPKDVLVRRENSIEKTIQKWPIDKTSTHVPIHLDDSRADLKFIINTLLQKHTSVMAKNQLKQIFSTLVVASKTPGAFLSTFATQLEIILSVLSSTKHPYLTDHESHHLMTLMDDLNVFRFHENVIDRTFGFVSKYFSNFESSKLQNFIWNKDETFAQQFVNGLDPTQIEKLKEDDLSKNFAQFNKKDFVSYFEKRFPKVKFVDEVKKGKVYYVDNYETMNLVTSYPQHTARPRALFYLTEDNQFLPLGIQLNSRHKTKVIVTVNFGKNLKKMDWIGKSDPYIHIQVGHQNHQTSTQWNTLNPVWNESFEFHCLEGDSFKFVVKDKDLILDDYMGEFNVFFAQLKKGKTTHQYDIETGGIIDITFDVHDISEEEEGRITLPTMPNWTIAKLFVSSAYVSHHEIVSHNLRTHSVMETVSICLHHTLFKEHPIYGLLIPHLYYTDVINLLARKTLLKDDGTGLVSVLFSVGVDAYKVNDHYFKKFNYEEYMFPNMIKKKNIEIPNYYYEKDGNRMWKVIEQYVTNIIEIYYKNDDVILKDTELTSFLEMLKQYIPGMVTVKTLKDLIQLLSSFIFNSVGEHTVLHYAQLDQLSFAPLLPTVLNLPPPQFDDDSFGIPTDGYKLDTRQQRVLMKYLPTLGQSIMINSTFYPVTRPTDTPLISTKYNSFTEAPALKYFQEFIAEITKLSDEIKNDPSRKDYYYYSIPAQSINY